MEEAGKRKVEDTHEEALLHGRTHCVNVCVRSCEPDELAHWKLYLALRVLDTVYEVSHGFFKLLKFVGLRGGLAD